jgi:hypothetical protein
MIVSTMLTGSSVLLKFPFKPEVNDALRVAAGNGFMSCKQSPARTSSLKLILHTADQKADAKTFLDWILSREPWCHVSDFGLGKFSDGVKMSVATRGSLGPVGTPGYMAPVSAHIALVSHCSRRD